MPGDKTSYRLDIGGEVMRSCVEETREAREQSVAEAGLMGQRRRWGEARQAAVQLRENGRILM